MKQNNSDDYAGTAITILLDPSSFVVIALKTFFASMHYHHYNHHLHARLGEVLH